MNIMTEKYQNPSCLIEAPINHIRNEMLKNTIKHLESSNKRLDIIFGMFLLNLSDELIAGISKSINILKDGQSFKYKKLKLVNSKIKILILFN